MSVWTDNPHLEPELRRLIAKNVSAGGIARTLKVSRNQIIGKANRLGLAFKCGPGGSARLKRRPGRPPEVETRDYALPSPPRRFSWQDDPHVR